MSSYLLRFIHDFAVLLKLSGLGVVMASKSTSWNNIKQKKTHHHFLFLLTKLLLSKCSKYCATGQQSSEGRRILLLLCNADRYNQSFKQANFLFTHFDISFFNLFRPTTLKWTGKCPHYLAAAKWEPAL